MLREELRSRQYLHGLPTALFAFHSGYSWLVYGSKQSGYDSVWRRTGIVQQPEKKVTHIELRAQRRGSQAQIFTARTLTWIIKGGHTSVYTLRSRSIFIKIKYIIKNISCFKKNKKYLVIKFKTLLNLSLLTYLIRDQSIPNILETSGQWRNRFQLTDSSALSRVKLCNWKSISEKN